ncbi:hypothetical protein Godav_019739 [Gossypium davidsonii]|uniref:Uncharacterized protein n=1 Tax=Gossypium davidsonii TaxID=34287 RepID=A0A7J8R1L6_GOSDV|nr:hypothetical protein [Gossypium davidsonii]
MDRNQDQNAIVGVVASVLPIGAIWIKKLITRKEISSNPRMNQDYERENYINSILYSGGQHCIDVIRMRLIGFFNEQLGKIANALEQFTADKTPHLYKKVMSMEEEGFDDDFLCFVFDYLVKAIDTFNVV